MNKIIKALPEMVGLLLFLGENEISGDESLKARE
jgi:hypothetical protein